MPLLTIAIPTYNRSNFLRNLLESIKANLQEIRLDVEILIIDNNSTDDTEKIVELFKQFYPIGYIKNEENGGFNYSLKRIIEKYNGDFLWIIGDDEVLNFNCILQIINFLTKDVDLLGLNFEYTSNPIKTQTKVPVISLPPVISFEALSSKSYKRENILNTFISSLIMNREIVNRFDTELFGLNLWLNTYDIFPFASQLPGINKEYRLRCMFIQERCFLATKHKKTWNSKLHYLRITVIPELLDLYKKNLPLLDPSIEIDVILISIKSIFKNKLQIKQNAYYLVKHLINLKFYKALLKLSNEKILSSYRN